MRIVLQHKETQLYFKDIDVWTPSSKEAMDFGSSTKAIEFCLHNHFQDVQIVLRFDEEKCSIVLDAVASDITREHAHSAPPA